MMAKYLQKSRLAARVTPLIPKHTSYIEPFCGAASVLFAKPDPGIAPYSETISDTNGRVSDFLRRLRNDPAGIQSMSRPTDGYHGADGREWGVEDALRAHSVAEFINKSDGFQAIASRLSKVQIDNSDAIEIITSHDSSESFFFVSPPYPDAADDPYGEYQYSHGDFANLVDTLDGIAGSFVLSCPEFTAPEHWDHFAVDVNGDPAAKHVYRVIRPLVATTIDSARALDLGLVDCFTGEDFVPDQDGRPVKKTDQMDMFDV